MPAKIIVLEGLDGAGKSTQIEILKKYLQEKNLTYTYVHFPNYGHNDASNIITAFLQGEYGDINKVDPIFVANIYAMDRFLYLPELQRHIEKYDVVLLDRYVFSNMAYQGAKYNSDTQTQIIQEWIEEFEFGFLELPYPDLNIFFDVPIDSIKIRLLEKQNTPDIHENNIEFQSNVRECYKKLKHYDNFFIINCGLSSPNEIFNKYKNLIDNVLSKIENDK